jgi:predicted RNase H-like HicB family nuclease
MKNSVVLEKQKEGGYTAQCSEIPGAISQGETKKEALENIKEAIGLMLEGIAKSSEKIVKVEVVA